MDIYIYIASFWHFLLGGWILRGWFGYSLNWVELASIINLFLNVITLILLKYGCQSAPALALLMGMQLSCCGLELISLVALSSLIRSSWYIHTLSSKQIPISCDWRVHSEIMNIWLYVPSTFPAIQVSIDRYIPRSATYIILRLMTLWPTMHVCYRFNSRLGVYISFLCLTKLSHSLVYIFYFYGCVVPFLL